MKEAQFVVITGLSGAGKSLAIRCFEDMGFFCVDNIPPILVPKFTELCAQSKVQRGALVSDLRGGEFFNDLFESLKVLESAQVSYEILFLEATDEVLVRRFSETRRKHPLTSGRVLDGIRKERKLLQEIRGRADRILDTSNLSPRKLRDEIVATYGSDRKSEQTLYVNFVSFGYKYGIPLDADLVFDVRFLPNPYYVNGLHALTGNHEAVREYVLKWTETGHLLEKLRDLLGFLVPQYAKEGKSQLTVAIGCTGGRHRSVIIANELAEFVRTTHFAVRVQHRDLRK